MEKYVNKTRWYDVNPFVYMDNLDTNRFAYLSA